jgi:glycosyltransferase involved in cell wall biosynthesis
MEKNKVLILCQLFYPELVSTGQTLTELGEALTELGVNVEVCCGPPTIIREAKKTPKDSIYQGIRIHRVWGTRFPKLSTAGKIINQITYAAATFFYLLFRQIDRPILVVTNPPFLGVVCAVLKKVKKLRFIYLVFDVYPDTAVNLKMIKKNGIMAKIWESCNKLVFASCDAYIVIGRCMAEVIRKKMDGKHASKIKGKERIIHVWGDDRNIQPLSKEKPVKYRKRWCLDGKFVLGYSGNMGRFHEMETIAKAAKAIRGNDDIRFLFIGEGYKKKWLQEFVEKNQLDNCILDTYVPREDLPEVLNLFDLGLVSLSPGQEGLSVPSKTFGLLAAGVPVIAVMSSVSEIAKIIEEESCGRVISPGDEDALVETIQLLYKNREVLDRMKKNARKAIDRKYSLEKAANAYAKLISIVAQK